jgi:glucose-1-phosphate adenylyltransferase
MNNLHGILFAYRSTPDLRELTSIRNISSLPFGGRYRIIDFMLSNLVNAGVTDVGVIMHENYQSLLDHLGSGKDWDLSRKHGGLRILPPFAYANKHRQGIFRGKMEALDGVSSYLQSIRQEYVVLADADIAINIDLKAALAAHMESGADITAVCTTHPTGDPHQCTYFQVGESGQVIDVVESPNTHVGYESLDMYIMSTDLLRSLVEHCATHNLYSFSTDVLTAMKDQLKIRTFLYDGYTARLQTVDTYYACSMDLLKPEVRTDLFAPERPIRTKDRSNPSTYYAPESKCLNSLVADGCIIEGEVENSILFRGVRVRKGAVVKNCILMQGTAVDDEAQLHYIIADKDVQIGSHRTLMGHGNYPLVIAKGSTV